MPRRKNMSKKKKIIISIVFVVVLLGSIITGIILANIKRFSMRAQSEFDFNNHTRIEEISLDSKYNPVSEVGYSNNGVKPVRTIDNKMGLYSYVQNKMIVEPIYDNIKTLHNDSSSKKSYFKLIYKDDINHIEVVDEYGSKIDFLRYNQDQKLNEATIKIKDIDYTTKNNNVKAKVNNKFIDKTIQVSDIDFDTTYFYDGLFFYEVWTLTTYDNIEYQNLYQITKDGYKLIQTINTETGIALDRTDLSIMFLTNGNPILIGHRDQSFKGEVLSSETLIYDINFNLKGSAKISTELDQYEIASFRVGNNVIFQYKIPATEDKYTLAETDSTSKTYYYRLETYKLSLKNGSFNQITFDYLINSYYDQFNLETVLINASKIKDKKAQSAENLLTNERLQLKPIDYEFNHITKINDDRYIASLDNTSNFNLIDRNYNLISHFENCTSLFATDDTIIANDSGYYYMCNTDGVILKKYSTNNIMYLRHDQYYIRKSEVVKNNITTYEYYLEQLGYSSETPLYTFTTGEKYKFNNQTYDFIKITYSASNPNLTLLMTVKLVDTTYTYELYTIEGRLLTTITGQDDYIYEPNVLYSDDNNVVIHLNNKYFVLDR